MRRHTLLISFALMTMVLCVPAMADPEPRPEHGNLGAEARPDYWGTGFFVDREGHVLTAGHVVAGCVSIFVRGPSHREPAALLAASERLDLALLRIDAPFGDPVAFATTQEPPAGAMVTILGYAPLRDALRVEGATRRADLNSMVLRDSASPYLALVSAASPGASGSPVIGADGLVIGILQRKLERRGFMAVADRPSEIRIALGGPAAENFLRSEGVAPLEGRGPQGSPMRQIGDLASAEVEIECYGHGD